MKLKKVIAIFMVLCMTVSLMGINTFAASKSIKLNKSSVSLNVGKTYTLKPTVKGFDSYTLLWTSSDKNIVKVSSSGKITAVKAGTATIGVKVKGTSYIAKCKVTVKAKTTAAVTTTAKKAETTTAAAETKQTSSSSKTASEFVKNIKIGWNLGNTLDATGGSGLSSETSWGNPKTTKEMIDTVKKAGFNAVRIPTSWGKHMDASGNIDSAWMARVKEVVDYAYKNDMYVILNVHHDNSWLLLSDSKEKETTTKFKKVWTQIADTFKDYNDHLIFEGMNEPRTEGTANEWNGGSAAERKVINNLNQAFVDTVRASGGSNKTRFLMVTPHAASIWATSDFVVPNDNRIIVSIHSYSPYDMGLNSWSDVNKFDNKGKNEINNVLNTIKTRFTSKGIPVIIGECGWMNKDNESERVEAAKYFVSEAKKMGVPLFLWDNGSTVYKKGSEGFGLFDRKNLTWYYNDLVKAIVNAAK